MVHLYVAIYTVKSCVHIVTKSVRIRIHSVANSVQGALPFLQCIDYYIKAPIHN